MRERVRERRRETKTGLTGEKEADKREERGKDIAKKREKGE